ncbi:juvenile hormone epoxide hydrolase 1-like [Musca vetustissima]|nr:juvenile hormone epoxide hydrolase 1-like [Musca vetustissima]
MMRNLMLRLGYKKFFIQGTDWGSIIGSHIATLFPENVLGYHSNMCTVSSPKSMIKGLIAGSFPGIFAPKGYEDFFSPVSEKIHFLLEETGYAHLHSTKPDTIGTALHDNPVGLAAYILEKFSTWTNATYRHLPDGGLKKRYKLDALLDNVMIYYLTNSITTSMRIYKEAVTEEQRALKLDRVPTNVPTACARFKNEMMHFMDLQLKDKYKNLIQSTYYKEGGHFAAMEVSDIVYKDFIEFVKKVEKIKKITGYKREL